MLGDRHATPSIIIGNIEYLVTGETHEYMSTYLSLGLNDPRHFLVLMPIRNKIVACMMYEKVIVTLKPLCSFDEFVASLASMEAKRKNPWKLIGASDHLYENIRHIFTPYATSLASVLTSEMFGW